MFDPPERVRWARIPYTVNQAPAHDALALKAARSSLVLLKNDGILPLRDVQRIAIIGRSARQPYYQGGGSYATPGAQVSPGKSTPPSAPPARNRALGGRPVRRRRTPPASAAGRPDHR